MARRRGTSRRGGYAAAVGLALVGLTPFAVLSTATFLLTDDLAADLHTDRSGVALGQALADAGYALFVVVAAELRRRRPVRGLGIGGQSAAAVGALICTCSSDLGWFTVGRVLHAAATGMMLVIALPPLIGGQPPGRLPSTVVYLNVGLFGAATAGPSIGGLTAGWHAWRALFGLVTAVAAVGAVLAARALAPEMADTRRSRGSGSAIVLAAAATVPPFLAVSLLDERPVTSPAVLAGIGIGLVALVTLVTREYRSPQPVLAVRAITHTLPVIGVLNAMLAGAGFTVLIEIAMAHLARIEHQGFGTVSLAMSTPLLGMAAAAWVFRSTISSRWLPVTVLGGLLAVGASGAVLMGVGPGPNAPLVAAAGALLGFGAGAGVAPGLLLAALSVPSDRLGGALALIQLLRIVGAFLVGPIVARLLTEPDPVAALRHGAFLVAAIAVLGAAALTALLLAGGARPHAPNVHAWIQEGDRPGLHSPRLGGVLRETHHDD